MKNVKENQLKKRIFIELDAFTSIIEKITDGLLTVEYEDLYFFCFNLIIFF